MPDSRFRLRSNWRGQFILQVRETRNHVDPMDMSDFTSTRWRDAKLTDIPFNFDLFAALEK